MKRNRSIIYGITITLLVTLILLGLTYAYYRTKVIGNPNDESISVTSKNLEVTYGEDTNEIVTQEGGVAPGDTLEKTFKVTNTGDDTATFTIILDNITNEFARLDWTYKLYKDNANGEPIAEGIVTNKLKKQVLKVTTINKGATDKYILKLEYADLPEINQSEDMGKELSLRVNIISPNENIFAEEEPNTLLYAIGRDNPVVNPLTTPGRQPSSSEETLLSYTEDDYGTSYYFRGKVDNNFVTMGNQCWRIVRVQGDGSIKITLYDEKLPCAHSIDNPTGAFMSEKGEGSTTYKTAYNDSFNDKKYVKFEGSTIQSALSDWYGFDAINLDTYNNQIEQEAEWCNDVSESRTSGSIIYFGAQNRLSSVSTAHPSLKCKTLEGGSEESIYQGKIALLSVDEIAFAGSTNWFREQSWDYYLKVNATGILYWSLSPYNFDGNAACVWYMYPSGGFDDNYNVNRSDGLVRPALVLKSTVTISPDSNGTQTNPYVIQ